MTDRQFWTRSFAVVTALAVVLSFALSRWYLVQSTDEITKRLILLNELRASALTQYFATAEAELRFWASSEDIRSHQLALIAEWRSYLRLAGDPAAAIRDLYIDGNPHPPGKYAQLNDPMDGSRYSDLHARFHPMARAFVSERGYYDLFLVGPEGNVFYTVEKEDDFGSQLFDDEWGETGLEWVFNNTRKHDGLALSDMSPYGPSGDAPAIFMGMPLNDVMGRNIGALVFQLPNERIREIMQFTAGMGETGETYLVGVDGLMRSDSRFSEESTVLVVEVNTSSVQRALAGESGHMWAEDYRGVEVLSVYGSVSVGEHRWAVLAEIDRAEILSYASAQMPRVVAIMSLFVGLSLWSIWYWRSRPEQLDSYESQLGLDLDEGMGPPS